MLIPFGTSEQRIYKKMGFYSDQDGIYRRYANEAGNWREHLGNTKAFICKSAMDKGKNKAAILGSGWLLDIPISEMCEIFREVWLIDIRHPSFVRHKMRKFKNVKLIEKDISGYAVTLHEFLKSSSDNFGNFGVDFLKPVIDFSLEDFDFVVSCNMLDQLDDIPVEYLLTRKKIGKDDELLLRRRIQHAHLEYLPTSRSCVITDIEELSVDNDGRIINEKKLVYPDLSNTRNQETWIWKFDTRCTYNPNFQTWFKVCAFEK